MSREIIADVLLALAVLVVAAAALGVMIMPTAYARLHYVTPAVVVAPVLVVLAVFSPRAIALPLILLLAIAKVRKPE